MAEVEVYLLLKFLSLFNIVYYSVRNLCGEELFVACAPSCIAAVIRALLRHARDREADKTSLLWPHSLIYGRPLNRALALQ
jgi:hypothetical protein